MIRRQAESNKQISHHRIFTLVPVLKGLSPIKNKTDGSSSQRGQSPRHLQQQEQKFLKCMRDAKEKVMSFQRQKEHLSPDRIKQKGQTKRQEQFKIRSERRGQKGNFSQVIYTFKDPIKNESTEKYSDEKLRECQSQFMPSKSNNRKRVHLFKKEKDPQNKTQVTKSPEKDPNNNNLSQIKDEGKSARKKNGTKSKKKKKINMMDEDRLYRKVNLVKLKFQDMWLDQLDGRDKDNEEDRYLVSPQKQPQFRKTRLKPLRVSTENHQSYTVDSGCPSLTLPKTKGLEAEQTPRRRVIEWKSNGRRKQIINQAEINFNIDAWKIDTYRDDGF